MGIGVVPESDWKASYSVLQLDSGGSVSSGGSSLYTSANAKRDETNWKYINNQYTSLQSHNSDGTIDFKVAPSGTADTAISWTTAMTITNAGNAVMSKTGTGNHDKWDFSGGYSASSNIAVAGNSTRLSLQASGTQIGAIYCTNTGTLYNTGNGGGIDFSGNTNYSGMTSEVLDDYEEGTWTPGLAGETSGTASFASASGYYVKVGRIVTLYCYVNSTIDTTGLSGVILITGLPYNATTWMGNGTLTYADSLTNKNEQDITLTVVAYTSSRFRIYEGSSSGAITSSELNTGTLKFMLTATYRT